MSETEALRLLHVLSLFVFVGGLMATLLPLYRAWGHDDVGVQVHAFHEAARSQKGVLLPGMIATGASGFLWALRQDGIDPAQTGWLMAVEALYLVALFVLLPGMVTGLRRARLLVLQAQKTGEISPELEATLADRGPVAFGTIMGLLVIVMTILAVVQP